jgi:hypothetical protein
MSKGGKREKPSTRLEWRVVSAKVTDLANPLIELPSAKELLPLGSGNCFSAHPFYIRAYIIRVYLGGSALRPRPNGFIHNTNVG